MGLWVKKVKGKVKNKTNSLKKSKQIYNTSPVLQDEQAKQYLKDLPNKYNFKTLPIMYWFPKMDKTPAEAKFIVASRQRLSQRHLQKLLN